MGAKLSKALPGVKEADHLAQLAAEMAECLDLDLELQEMISSKISDAASSDGPGVAAPGVADSGAASSSEPGAQASKPAASAEAEVSKADDLAVPEGLKLGIPCILEKLKQEGIKQPTVGEDEVDAVVSATAVVKHMVVFSSNARNCFQFFVRFLFTVCVISLAVLCRP